MTNFSSEPMQVLRWYTPLEQASAGLFNVTRNGEAVDYVGALVKRGVPTSADYVTIAAGDSITRSVKVSSLYDFSATGVYIVEYGRGMHVPWLPNDAAGTGDDVCEHRSSCCCY